MTGFTVNSYDNSLLNFTYGNGLSSTTTTNALFPQYGEKKLVDVIVTPETVEVHYKQKSNIQFSTNTYISTFPQSNDLAIKEIYGVKDGRMQLIKTVYGKVVAPQWTPESLEFDE